ncbi:sulfotransferase [Rhodobacteraceae bacterium N5(2021)]|uniref:Sulfotransferase n=2 Tax=Gymnodinialimonas phycosphaerae TaxID=2841589 RepID=A0ABS7MPV6_9RHOB|nr:sulfotransferase [Gymnodinialimonas phycosphaerae]MBY4892156.1 sulfotransferase [Gymnodinialimonas phycosphaerae]
MMPATDNNVTPNDAFLEIYEKTAGLIPHSLSHDGSRLTWIDLGSYHMYEGSYQKASHTAVALLGRGPDTVYQPFFTTELSVIDDLTPAPDDVSPTAFIFGVSRCGSTLLTRALARDRRILAFGEALIPNGLWRLGGPSTLTHATGTIARLRKVITLMGRNRGGGYRHMVLKLSSVELHAASPLRAAFPDAPCLFMYRNPTEVLVSHLNRKPGWHDAMSTDWGSFLCGQETPQTTTEFYAKVLRGYYSVAMSDAAKNWTLLQYPELAPHRLPDILAALGIDADDVDLTAMSRCFRSYSKSPYQNAQFADDQGKKQRDASAAVAELVATHLDPLHQALAQAPQNLAPHSDAGAWKTR